MNNRIMKVNIEMTIKQMKYIVTIAQCGTLSLAAEKLNITQPSLSWTTREVEKELGYKIFFRNKTGMMATAKGEQIIRSAGRVIEEYDKFINTYCTNR